MKTKIGTYTGTGARFTLPVGFNAKAIFIKGDTTQNLAWITAKMWCGRTNSLSALDSIINGVRVIGSNVYVGTSAQVNSSGVRYHWLAIGEDAQQDFDIQSWMGNQTAARTITLPTGKTPVAAIIKRDSILPAAIKVGSATTAFADGTAATDCIAFGSGVVTLTAATAVNQYDSAGGLGEGIDGLFIHSSTNAENISWSSGSSGQIVPTTVTDPIAAIIVRTDTTGVAARFLTRDMKQDNYAAPVSNLALTVNEASLLPGGIRLGSAATLRTGSFSAIVFGRNENNPERLAPAIVVKSKKAIYLPGRGVAGQVDCGVSDATLKIDGAISMEWCGVAWPDQGSSQIDMNFIMRGIGPAASIGAYSWGMGALNRSDSNWSGPMFHGIVTNQVNFAAPLDAAVWRTGILCPWGRPLHVIMTHNGTGGWKLYLDGVLMKQRSLNLATNIVSGVGHRTALGMRRNTADTAWTQAQKMLIIAARVYSAELTQDQVATRFAKQCLGASEDVTSNLAEAWDATNASGVSLPATVNSANNGTISATGSIVIL